MTLAPLTMGTRGSALALAQARQVAAALQAAHPGLVVRERIIRTTGDVRQGAALPAIGGKGVFTLEIERALLDGSIDFAVHSLKDLPPALPPALCLAAIPKRESAADVCLVRAVPYGQAVPLAATAETLALLKPGAKVGTSSLRRAAQLQRLRPDLCVAQIRGNIDTRIGKLLTGEFDAIVLAAAGLNRLQPATTGCRRLELDEHSCVPAPGQGALGIEARDDDVATLALLSALADAPTRAEVAAERATMSMLGAGCSTPMGARAVAAGDMLTMWAAVLSEDGVQCVSAEGEGSIAQAEEIGELVARRLLAAGAGVLVAAQL